MRVTRIEVDRYSVRMTKDDEENIYTMMMMTKDDAEIIYDVTLMTKDDAEIIYWDVDDQG